MDFSGSFKVTDSSTNELLGILKRKGFTSLFFDEWAIMDRNRKEVGLITEDSALLGLIRRRIPMIPNVLFIEYNGKRIAKIVEHFKFWGNEYDLFIENDPNKSLDRRLAVAALLMMAMFETLKTNWSYT